jgi:hypothetical protein
LELAKSIYVSSREGNLHYARRHYDGGDAITFVHSVTGLRTLKDEFDEVAAHNQHPVDQIERALLSSYPRG